jgi:DNA repair protein RadC
MQRGMQETRLKARTRGVEALGDLELLSLLLGCEEEPGRSLLRAAGGMRGLMRSSARQLASAGGVGEARVLRVVAALELGRRAASLGPGSADPIRSSADVHLRLAPLLAPLENEVFFVLGLDARGRVMLEQRVAEGGLTECPVQPRDVFRPLLRAGAVSCILVHNHPSGEPSPSTQDRLMTMRMAEAGRLIGLRVVDHMILASGGWYSFRDAGLL